MTFPMGWMLVVQLSVVVARQKITVAVAQQIGRETSPGTVNVGDVLATTVTLAPQRLTPSEFVTCSCVGWVPGLIVLPVDRLSVPFVLPALTSDGSMVIAQLGPAGSETFVQPACGSAGRKSPKWSTAGSTL